MTGNVEMCEICGRKLCGLFEDTIKGYFWRESREPQGTSITVAAPRAEIETFSKES